MLTSLSDGCPGLPTIRPRAAGVLSFLFLFPAGSDLYKSSQHCSVRLLCLGKEGWQKL